MNMYDSCGRDTYEGYTAEQWATIVKAIVYSHCEEPGDEIVITMRDLEAASRMPLEVRNDRYELRIREEPHSHHTNYGQPIRFRP